jgi:hypothetical protein
MAKGLSNSGRPEAIRQMLARAHAGLTTREIAEELGIETRVASTNLIQMEERGELVRSVVERPRRAPDILWRLTGVTAGARPFRLPGTPLSPKPLRRDEIDPPVVKAVRLLGSHLDRPPGAGAPSQSPTPTVLEQQAPEAPERPAPAPQRVEVPATVAEQGKYDTVTHLPEHPVATPAPPQPRGQFRAALYSDGTLILEHVPNGPEILALSRECSRTLVDYLLSFHSHADEAHG